MAWSLSSSASRSDHALACNSPHGLVVVRELARPSLLPPVRGRALQVPEDDVEDVDDVVTSASPEIPG
jgi:hypothetical protein